jgi:quinoprotein glucose dehydrogenase
MTTKDGRVFVLNRETGEPVYPVEYRPAPSSSVPGETAAESQPWPVTPKVIARNSVTIDELTTRTPEAYADALKRFKTLISRGPFDPPSLEGTILYPDFDGAVTYGSGAVDPGNGLAIYNVKEIAAIAKLVSNKDGARETARTTYLRFCASCHGYNMEGSGEIPALVGLAERADLKDIVQIIATGRGRMPAFRALFSEDTTSALASYVRSGEDQAVTEASMVDSPEFLRFRFDGYKRFLDIDGYPATKPPWGQLVALDLNTGEVLWKVPFGEHPELVAEGLKDTGSLNYGGGVLTAGGLYFVGASLYDNAIRAYDVTDGQLLWRADLPASAPSVPAVYQAGGRQHIVIAAGGGKRGVPSGSKYVAFALPRDEG